MSHPVSFARALGAIAALLPLAASAAAPAQPQFTPLAGKSLSDAKRLGKPAEHNVRPAQVSTEIRATLGADGKVHTDCVTVNRSAFAPTRAPAQPHEPTEQQ